MSEPDPFELLFDLHAANDRQGPGSAGSTRLAIELAGLDRSRPLEIADLGCGTGSSALVLAATLDARVTAVDFGRPFLERLEARAAAAGLADRIETIAASIEDLPFESQRFDVLWSEGAIYNIGFERGIGCWRRLLKPGGVLVVSEITWLSATRPTEIEEHWNAVYPEIDLASAKIARLEQAGYSPTGYFTLPVEDWLASYYEPLEAGFEAFLDRHPGSEQARSIIEEERAEIELHRRFGEYYSYGVYIARLVD